MMCLLLCAPNKIAIAFVKFYLRNTEETQIFSA